MGYELTRFQGNVDEELICPICKCVLEEPLQAALCEHAFCRACINEWLARQPTCPVDRNAITTTNLRPVPRILKNLLSRLSISCDNAPYGCAQFFKLEVLTNHLEDCEYNPKKPLPCERGCGSIIPKDEFKDHNCIRELRAVIHSQQQVINELKREVQLFKELVRAMRASIPAMRAIADQMERDEVIRWSTSLARARVTRWGGMISTPDEALQVE